MQKNTSYKKLILDYPNLLLGINPVLIVRLLVGLFIYAYTATQKASVGVYSLVPIPGWAQDYTMVT